MRKLWLFAASAILTCSNATFATASELEDLVKPSESDFSSATEVIKPIIARLIEGDAKVAIDGAFADNPLFDRIKPQLPNLAGQLNTMFEIYGPIAQCEQAQRSSIGTLSIKFVYICQHEKFVSQWEFLVVKSQHGWILSKLNFSDND